MSIEVSSLVSGLRLLRRLVEHVEGANTRDHERDRDEEFRFWLAEVALAAGQAEERLGQLDQRVLDALEDREMQRIWRNLTFEAAREAIDERRRMLAYAAIGTALSAEHLTIAQIARVERTLRELDPADVSTLARIAEIRLEPLDTGADDAAKERHRLNSLAAGEKRYRILMAVPPSGEVLRVGGCVRVYRPPIWDSTEVADLTTLGQWVLLVSDPFLRASAPPS